MIASEAQEQVTLFQWAHISSAKWPELSLMHAIPNGGSRDAREAHNLKLQGVLAGVPDICLPCARGGFHGLYIELKRKQGGRVSDAQGWMIKSLREQGYCAEVCNGWEEAAKLIVKYMEGKA